MVRALRSHPRCGTAARRLCPTGALLAAMAVAAACCLLTGCPSKQDTDPIKVVVEEPGGGGGTPEDIQALARREGQLSWYTSLPQDQASAFLERFAAKYPFINCDLVRESTFDITQRLQSEIEAGRSQADVLHVLDVAVFVKLRKNGQLLRYSSPEESRVYAAYKDPGFWSSMRCVALCIAYNSNRVKTAEAPRNWDDLLEPQWKGRIGLKDAQTAGSAYAEYYFLRERYGTSFWERMSRQNPHIYKTAEESLAALARGEVSVVSGAMDYSVVEAARNGDPIVDVRPVDGVPMMLGPVAILRNAPHPNCARLFMDFVLSRQGQETLRDLLGAYSSRSDVAPPKGRPALSELKAMTPAGGWDEYAQNQDVLRAEYTRLFHPGSE